MPDRSPPSIPTREGQSDNSVYRHSTGSTDCGPISFWFHLLQFCPGEGERQQLTQVLKERPVKHHAKSLNGVPSAQ